MKGERWELKVFDQTWAHFGPFLNFLFIFKLVWISLPILWGHDLICKRWDADTPICLLIWVDFTAWRLSYLNLNLAVHLFHNYCIYGVNKQRMRLSPHHPQCDNPLNQESDNKPEGCFTQSQIPIVVEKLLKTREINIPNQECFVFKWFYVKASRSHSQKAKGLSECVQPWVKCALDTYINYVWVQKWVCICECICMNACVYM